MGIAPLNIPEGLRPWRNLGLAHVITEGSACLKFHYRNDRAVTGRAGVPSQASPPSAAPAPGRPTQPAQPQRPGAGPRDVQSQARPGCQTRQSAVGRAQPSPPEAVNGHFGGIDTSAWPANWQKVLPAKKGCPMLWSYPELGSDMLFKEGPGCKARSGCFKAMFERLSLFRGTSVFWPMAMPDESGAVTPNPDIFLSGLKILNPKAVLLCGPESVRASGLGLEFSHTYEERLSAGRLFILFPSTEQLIENRQVFEGACGYLQSRFAEICALHQPKGGL